VNDPLPPKEESLATRRARVLARMAISRSALKAESDQNSAVPSSSQPGTAIVAPTAPSSLLNRLLASPNAQMVAALLVGSVIFSPRRMIIAAAIPTLRAVISRTVRDLVAA
jgi:hypothetical protein